MNAPATLPLTAPKGARSGWNFAGSTQAPANEEEIAREVTRRSLGMAGALDPEETPSSPEWAHRALRAALPAELLDDAGTEERTRALRWVRNLKTNVTEGRAGTRSLSRTARIARCGWWELTWNPRTDRPGLQRHWCRDRACPVCAKRRSREMRAKLRRFQATREKEVGPRRLVFLTLTHRKAMGESPGDAVSRLLGEWRRLMSRRKVRGGWVGPKGHRRWKPGAVAGYVRAVECTWSPRGPRTVRTGERTVTKDGDPRTFVVPEAVTYFVAHDGWHAHLHVILELSPGVNPAAARELITDAWTSIADAEPWCQRWQALSPHRVGQVAKYITKPFELPEDLAPRFFDELSQRRLIESGGTWRAATRNADRGTGGTMDIPQGIHLAELVVLWARDQKVPISWCLKKRVPVPVACWRDADERVLRQVSARDVLPRVFSMAKALASAGQVERLDSS